MSFLEGSLSSATVCTSSLLALDSFHSVPIVYLASSWLPSPITSSSGSVLLSTVFSRFCLCIFWHYPCLVLSPTFSFVLFIYIFTGSAMDWTQDFALARQALDHLSCTSILFAVAVFQIASSLLPGSVLDHESPTYTSCAAGVTAWVTMPGLFI
jgi:hypothetical protein